MNRQVQKYGKYVKKNYPAFKKRAKVYYPAVRQLASDVMYLKGLINSEPQSFTVQSANNVNYAGSIVSFNQIVQGDEQGMRTGNRILPRYFSMNMSWGMGNTSTVKKVIARAILFRWYGDASSIANTPIPSEILNITIVGSLYSPLAHLNPNVTGPKGDRIRRIEVLKNELCTFSSTSNWSDTVSFNIDLNPKEKANKEHIEYLNNVTAEPISGGLYLLLVSDQSVSTEFGYQLEGKLTFYDN